MNGFVMNSGEQTSTCTSEDKRTSGTLSVTTTNKDDSHLKQQTDIKTGREQGMVRSQRNILLGSRFENYSEARVVGHWKAVWCSNVEHIGLFHSQSSARLLLAAHEDMVAILLREEVSKRLQLLHHEVILLSEDGRLEADVEVAGNNDSLIAYSTNGTAELVNLKYIYIKFGNFRKQTLLRSSCSFVIDRKKFGLGTT